MNPQQKQIAEIIEKNRLHGERYLTQAGLIDPQVIKDLADLFEAEDKKIREFWIKHLGKEFEEEAKKVKPFNPKLFLKTAGVQE